MSHKQQLLQMIKDIVAGDEATASKLFSSVAADKVKSALSEVYNTADGPHNNWGMDDDEFADDFDGDDVDEYGDIRDIPRGDRDIEDLEADGEFDDYSTQNKEQLTFTSHDQANYVVDLLQRWGIDADVKGKAADSSGDLTDGDATKYEVRFEDDDGSIRQEIERIINNQLRA